MAICAVGKGGERMEGGAEPLILQNVRHCTIIHVQLFAEGPSPDHSVSQQKGGIQWNL